MQTLELPRCPYHELLRERARRHPHKEAVIFQGHVLTYGQLDDLSDNLAQGIKDLGVRKGDRVALAMYTRPEFILSFYGVAKAGGVVTPVNPSLKRDELGYQLRDAGARLAIVDGRVAPVLASIRETLPELENTVLVGGEAPGEIPFLDLLSTPARASNDLEFNSEEDLVALPYSSGTTGRPKGVMLTHRNLLATHLQYVRAGKVGEHDVSLIFLPLAHVYGLLLTGGAIAAGATQILMERYQLEEVLELVARYRVTLLYVTPAVLAEMANFPDLPQYDLSSIRYINSGGARLPPEVARAVEERTGRRVVGGYGLTEVPISGPLVPGEERRVVDLETGERELPPGEIGELVVRGPHVMKGYWRDPELTRQALRDGWFYTGDVGMMDERGRVHILDRKKELMKYKGFAVSPAELEEVLLTHPGVADCAVVGIPDPVAGERPKAFVVLKPGVQTGPQELLDFVAHRVAGYKQLRAVEIVEALPRNPAGKIVKRELRERR